MLLTNVAQIVDSVGSDPFSWDAAKVIIDYQSTLIYFYVGFVGLLFAAVTAIWWFVNWRNVRIKLEETVQSAKSQAKDSIDAAILEFENRIGGELSVRKKDFAELKEMMIKQGRVSDFETSRLLAMVCSNQEMFGMAAYWWLEALVGLIELRKVTTINEEMLRTTTNAALESLNKIDKLGILEKEKIKTMRESAKRIPEILGKEKKQIQSKLNELVKKTPRLSH